MIQIPPGTDALAQATPSPRFKLGRLGPFLLIGQLGWAIPGSASAVLLQAICADLAPTNKVAVYTVFAIAGAVTSALGTVVGGMLSDHTRSRFGKRSPWLIGAALVATLGLAGTGLTTSLVLIGIFYAIFQAGIGAWVAVLSALIPDRVAAGSIGRASAFAGFGYLLGQTIGGIVGASFVTQPQFGLIVVPWILVVAALLIAVFVRGRDNRTEPKPARAGHFLRDLVPPRFADFWFAFAGRFFFILAIVLLTVFQLFTLTDYLKLSTVDAGGVIGVATLLFGALAAITVIISGPLSDRVGRKKPFIIAAPLLVGLALIPLLIAPNTDTYILFFAITGIAFGTYISVDQALMVAVLPNPATAARDLGF